jgi:4-amino-4-deoxy-L-arabinose transferase-like glycosyltransferase
MISKSFFGINQEQKKTLFVLCLIGIIYFCIFIYPNFHKGEGNTGWSYFSQDEFTIYPYLMKMMGHVSSIPQFWGDMINNFYRFYGFPYSFLSVLVLLPVRLALGENFFSNTQFNIFLLRQLINVIPIILMAGGLVYFQTYFKNFWRSSILFIFLLSIPEVFRSNIRWWHPDSLGLLSISLTFAFLLIDKYKLKTGFYLAAVACGMAVSIKMAGAFFFLAIPVYLFLVWLNKKSEWKRIILAALLFLLVMSLTFILTNPFLFYEAPRTAWMNIQFSKTGELAQGYSHDDPYYYQKGLIYWKWTIINYFGQYWFIAFLLLAVILGCVWGENKLQNRLLLAWLIPLGIYLSFFVAPKPAHYLSPFMLPLFSSVFNWFDLGRHWIKPKNKYAKVLQIIVLVLVLLIIGQQFIFHFVTDYQIATSVEYF